jgi:hypothetical protein
MPDRTILLSLLLLLSACATRQTAPGAYRLVNSGPAAVLIPPGISAPEIKTGSFDFPIQKPASSACRTRDDAIRVDPHSRYLRIRVDPQALIAHPAPWLATWIAGLQERGCLTPSESSVLAEQIVESVPLNPATAYRLLHHTAYGIVDLLPGYRLKLVSPILREGAPAEPSALTAGSVTGSDSNLSVSLKSSPDFLGYEVSWYEVQRTGALVFDTAESHLGQQVIPGRTPRINYFSFPATAAHYRLFYLTRVSQADHNAALLAAPTPAELIRQTAAFTGDPTACDKAPRQTCITLPKDVGLTVCIAVTMNGASYDVPYDATIADALRTAGIKQPATVLPSLSIRRRYKSTTAPLEFDRSKPDILTLRLLGHEDLRW